MAEITSTGIIGKSLNDYLVELQEKYREIDPDWNIDADSPDGQIIGVHAEMLANLDEAVVAAYRSKDPASAIGEALNDIGEISGVNRQAATYSVAPISVTGAIGSIIPALTSQVRSRVDNTVWTLNSAIIIGADGTGTGFVTCTTPGRVPASIGDLTVIGTNIAGWYSVTNPQAATQGEPEESNSTFRARRTQSVSLPGSNMLDNMYASVGSVKGVTDVKVLENDRYDPVDVNGIPLHSIAVVVNGGSDADIALAMYVKKNPGAAMYPRYNDVTDTWIDPPGTNGVHVDATSPVTGNTKSMTFQRAIGLPVYVRYEIKQIGSLPSDIAKRITDATIADATKNLFADDSASLGFNQGGYDIGEVVPVGRFYTPANKVLGLYGDSYVNSITIGISEDNLAAAPIQPAYNQLPVFNEDNISVVVV